MQKSFKRRTVTPGTGSHFVVNGFRVVVAEYRVERNRVALVAGPLGVDEARECPGVTELSDHYRATIGFEYDDAAPGESLGHSLIDAQRNDVTKINGAAMVAQHATFDDDSLVRDVNLVRAPSPRARECDHGEGAREDQRQQHLVFVYHVYVLRTDRKSTRLNSSHLGISYA